MRTLKYLIEFERKVPGVPTVIELSTGLLEILQYLEKTWALLLTGPKRFHTYDSIKTHYTMLTMQLNT